MRQSKTVLAIFFLIIAFPLVSWASDVTFPVQGFVTDADTGEPIEGVQEVTFRLYETCSDNSAFYEVTRDIDFESGVYNAFLDLDENDIDTITATDELCLGIQINNDDELSPRIEYSTTPYALLAAQAQSANVANVALSVDSDFLNSLVGSGLSLSGSSLSLDTSSNQTWTGSQTYSEKTTFSESPTTTGSSNASVLINPASSVTDGTFFAVQNNGSDRFTVDAEGDVNVAGTIQLTGLTNCDTLDTDAQGNIVCGTDSTGLGGGDITGDTITAQEAFEMEDPGAGTEVISFTAPDGLATGYSLEWPSDDGTNGQVLTTDGSGTLSWTTASSGDITGVTAGTGLTGGGSSGDVTLNIDVGTGANQIVQLNGSGALPAIDGSNLTGVTPGTNTVNSASVVDGSLTSDDLGTDSVDSDEIAADAVGSSEIATGAVTTTEILDGTVAAIDLAGDSVNSAKIVDGSITSDDLGTDSVDSDEIATSAVTSTEILDGTITDDDIGDVGADKITGNFEDISIIDDDTNTVTLQTPSDISADYTLTLPADDGDSGEVLMTDGSGTLSWTTASSGDITGVTAGTGLTGGGSSGDVTLNIDVGTGANQIVQLNGSGALPAIDGSNLTGVTPGANTINSASVVDGSLTSDDLGTDSVDSDEIAANAVGSSEIATGAVTTAEILDGTIAAADIATGAVTTTEILDGTILPADISSVSGVTGADEDDISDDDISDLNDVDAAGVTGGQILVYNSATGNWENEDASTVGGDADTLDGLDSTAFAQVSNNLSDLSNAATARTNLGLGTLSTLNTVGNAQITDVDNSKVTGLGTLATLSAVGSSEITDGSIAAADLGTDSVGSDEIAADAVTASEIATSAVTTTEILDGTILPADISSVSGVTGADEDDISDDDISDLNDVDAAGVTGGQILVYNSATGNWENEDASTVGGDADTLDGLDSTAFAQVANNLSDLPSASTARTNLGLGTLSTLNTVGNAQITDVDNSKVTGLGSLATLSAVGSSEITDGSIAAADLGTDSVGSDEIAADAVTASEIATSAVTTTEILDGTILPADISSVSGVTGADEDDVSDDNVEDLANVDSGSATNGQILVFNSSTGNWENEDTSTITVGDADTLDGLDSTAFAQVSNNLSDLSNAATARTNLGLGTLSTLNSVGNAQITDVDNSKVTGLGTLATLSTVGSSEITDGSIAAADLGTDSVGSDEIAADAVTASEIATSAVTTTEILDGTILPADISSVSGVTGADEDDISDDDISDLNDVDSASATNGQILVFNSSTGNWENEDTSTITVGDADTLDGLDSTAFAQVANNLSDLPSASTARTNLGLGTLSTLNTVGNAQITDVDNSKVTGLGSLATLSAVGSSEITDGSIAAADIATGAVTTTEILDGTVALGDLAANSVDSSKIVDGSIAPADISSVSGVTGADEDDISDDDISDLNDVDSASATNGQILVFNSSTGNWENEDTSTITVGDADTLDGLDSTAFAQVSNNLSDLSNAATARTNLGLGTLSTLNSVGNAQITDVDNSKVTGLGTLATLSAVGSSEITDGSIAAADIATGAVTTTEILDGTVALGDLAANSVDSSKIVDGSIAPADISSVSGVTGADEDDVSDDNVEDLANVDSGSATNGQILVFNSSTGNWENEDSSTITVGDADTLDGLDSTAFAQVANNLSDLPSASTARTNLGLGTLATLNSVGNAQITDVDNSKVTGLGTLATLSAVGSSEITDGSIAAADLGTDSVGSDEIAADAVTASEIATSAVTTTEILDGTILPTDISSVSGVTGADEDDVSDDNVEDLANVDSASATNGQILVFNSSTGNWENEDTSTITVGDADTLDGLDSTAFAQVSNNLSDLSNAATARTNLGLGTLSTLNSVGNAQITDVDNSKVTGLGTLATLSTVGSSEITDGSIAAADLGTDSVGSDEIAADAVTASEIATSAVTTTEILDGTILPTDISSVSGVTGADEDDVSDDNVEDLANVDSGSATNGQILVFNSSTGNWENEDTSTITVGDADTLDGLDSTAFAQVSNNLSDLSNAATARTNLGLGTLSTLNSVGNAQITDVDNSKVTGLGTLATLSTVGSSEITDGSIAAADLGTDSVGSDEIAADAVTASEIATSAVTTTEILDGTILPADISSVSGVTGADEDDISDDDISDLNDVDSASATNGQILVFNSSTGNWENEDTSTITVGDADTLDGLDSTAFAQVANNLSDLPSASTARTNLGLGTLSTLNSVGNAQITDVDNSKVTGLGTLATLSAVGSSEITDGSIAAADIATGAVTTTEILDGTVALGDLAANSVDSSKIVDGSIAPADISSVSGVTGADEDDISDDDISDLNDVDSASATNGQILVFNSSTGNWENEDTSTITVGDADTLDGLDSTAFAQVSNNLSDLSNAATARTNLGLGTLSTLNSVGNAQITDVDNSKVTGLGTLATLSAVGSSEITDGSIAAADLGTDSVGSDEIAADAVTASEIATSAVTTTEILDGTILPADISSVSGVTGADEDDVSDDNVEDLANVDSGSATNGQILVFNSSTGNWENEDSTSITVGDADTLDGLDSTAFAQVANNLSDLSNAATARTNLGLGTLATLNTVGNAQITDVDNSKVTGLGTLATLSTVGSSEITDGSIAAADLGTDSVGSDEIAADAVTASEIATSAVTTTEILDGTILPADISSVSGVTGADEDDISDDDISDLNDVDSASATNGQILVFNSSTGNWENEDTSTITVGDADTLDGLDSTAFAQVANNLSDLPSASTARTNLGLGTLSTLNTVGNAQITDVDNSKVTGLGSLALLSTVGSSEITDGSIAAADLGTDSVGSDEIAADAVTASEIATSAVTTTEILDGTILPADISSVSGVTGADEDDISDDDISDLNDVDSASATNGQILVFNSSTGNWENEDTSTITVGDADTLDGLDSTAFAQVSNNLSDLSNAATARTNLGLGTLATLNTVGNAQITDVDNSKVTGLGTLATLSAVGSSEITDGSIAAADLGTDSVGSDEIAADAVTASEIATSAVTTTEILDGTILPADISSVSGVTGADEDDVSDDNVEDLANVDSGSATNGQILVFNSSTGNWENEDTSTITVGDADTLDGLDSTAFAQVTNNLSDLSNAATARTNLGLGTLSTLNTVGNAQITDVDNSKVTGLGSLALLSTVGSSEITDGSIAAADLGTDSVGSDEIAADAVTASEIATSAVTTTEILDGTILPADISSVSGVTGADEDDISDDNVEDLANVDSGSATNGQILVFNSSTGNWENEDTSTITVGDADTLDGLDSTAFAQVSNNLSDLSNAATARTNLGLGTLATLNTVGNAQITDVDNSKVTGLGSLALLSTVGSSEITDGSIAAADLGTDSVGSDEIAADAVTASEIATSAVTTTEILDGTILPADISSVSGVTGADEDDVSDDNVEDLANVDSASVTGGQILVYNSSTGNWENEDSTSITVGDADTLDGLDSTAFAQVANNLSDLPSASTARTNLGLGTLATLSAVGSSEITDGSIAAVDLGTDSVDSDEIAADAVTASEIATSAVTTTEILDGTVALGDLAGNSVNSAKIVDSSIALADLAGNSVNSAKIVDSSVALADLAGDSVNSSKIVDGTIATADMADDAVDLDKLADESKTHMKSMSIENPRNNDDELVQVKFANDVTINRISCSADSGATVTIQFDERSESTPNTSGTDVMTSTLVCDDDTEATTSFANATIAADAIMNLDIDARSGGPDVVRIHIDYTID